MRLGVDHPHYALRMCVAPARAFNMLGETPIEVSRNTCIERAIGTLKDVESIHRCYSTLMSELPPKPVSHEGESIHTHKEKIALARELWESGTYFPFPGIDSKEYMHMKAAEAEYPGYTTPIDTLIERFKDEGLKVVLGTHPESGNIFIIPAHSNDIENDSIRPQQLQMGDDMDARLKEL